MNLEHTEAFVIKTIQPCRLFDAYYLTESQLLSLIGMAHSAGQVFAGDAAIRKFDRVFVQDQETA